MCSSDLYYDSLYCRARIGCHSVFGTSSHQRLQLSAGRCSSFWNFSQSGVWTLCLQPPYPTLRYIVIWILIGSHCLRITYAIQHMTNPAVQLRLTSNQICTGSESSNVKYCAEEKKESRKKMRTMLGTWAIIGVQLVSNHHRTFDIVNVLLLIPVQKLNYESEFSWSQMCSEKRILPNLLAWLQAIFKSVFNESKILNQEPGSCPNPTLEAGAS